MREDKWSWKRFWMLVLIIITTALAAILILQTRERTLGERVLVVLCGLIFAVFFSLYMEWNRMEQGIFHEKANNFTRIALCYVMAEALTVLISFLPGYMRPVMIPPAVVILGLDSFAGLLCSGYFSVLLCLAGRESMTTLACYLFLSMFGCVLVPYLKKKGSIAWSCFMIFGVTFCVNSIFSFLDQKPLSLDRFLESMAGALISSGGTALLFRLCNDRIENSKDYVLARIIEDNYELVNTLRKNSKADYEHARKVSQIASACASHIGADPNICAAAGFYYRIGRMEGEPFVQNGVALARKKDFPPEVIRILAECNGEERLPSTIESALVHIVDNVVSKFDILDKSTLSSSWNQDIIIYQTLNENTARGLYDKSGVGMNMFMIIRDYLIKEAPLYDDHNGKQQ